MAEELLEAGKEGTTQKNQQNRQTALPGTTEMGPSRQREEALRHKNSLSLIQSLFKKGPKFEMKT
jgi:hypothetical protein